MLKLRCCALILGLVTAGSLASHGQALPTATQGGLLQVGVGVSTSNTDLMDLNNKNISGITVYAAYDLVHLGVEVDVHYLDLITPADFGENSVFIGPRYVFHYGRFDPYIKLQAGIGQIKIDEPYVHIPQAPGSFFAYAIGGGVDVKLAHHINFRADVDYQGWPSYGNHGLSPYVGTIGVAYRFR